MEFIRRCWAEVSLDALLTNAEKIKKLSGTEILCVVKANAYGHGDTEIVKELYNNGIKNFAVASVNEAVHIRKINPEINIIVLGGITAEAYPVAAEKDIILPLYDADQAKHMSDYAISCGKKIKVHIKLNTGMSRIGFDCINDEQCLASAKQIKQIYQYDGLDICGAFTHFSVSDEQDGRDFTKYQFDNFIYVKNLLTAYGVGIPVWHCANSGAIVNYPECSLDMVRAGIILYGMYNGYGEAEHFEPALSLKSVVTQVRSIDSDVSVSYGRSYVASGKTDVATVSIGYADGYPRSLSGKGKVIINGKFATVIGRVCMDQMMVDVTGIECNVGDTVTIIGTDGELTVSADDIAKDDGTINYEIVCRISSRIPRVYFKGGKRVAVTEYI